MYALIFLHDDGERYYVYSASFEYAEYAFRVPRVFGLTWTMDGDTWVSESTTLTEPGWPGKWTVSNTETVNPTFLYMEGRYSA